MIGLKNVTFSYEDKKVLDHYDLLLEEGKIHVLMGPSGQGKTTILRLLAGLEKPQEGEILTAGRCSVCFQEARLFPEMTCLDNLRCVLPKERKQEAYEWLKKVHLEKEAQNFPEELSGGMQKRLALARCLAYGKEDTVTLILLDEPFSALHEELRDEMRALVKAEVKNKTVLLISHDREDSLMADEIHEL